MKGRYLSHLNSIHPFEKSTTKFIKWNVVLYNHHTYAWNAYKMRADSCYVFFSSSCQYLCDARVRVLLIFPKRILIVLRCSRIWNFKLWCDFGNGLLLLLLLLWACQKIINKNFINCIFVSGIHLLFMCSTPPNTRWNHSAFSLLTQFLVPLCLIFFLFVVFAHCCRFISYPFWVFHVCTSSNSRKFKKIWRRIVWVYILAI